MGLGGRGKFWFMLRGMRDEGKLQRRNHFSLVEILYLGFLGGTILCFAGKTQNGRGWKYVSKLNSFGTVHLVIAPECS